MFIVDEWASISCYWHIEVGTATLTPVITRPPQKLLGSRLSVDIGHKHIKRRGNKPVALETQDWNVCFVSEEVSPADVENN